jgi:hypothetical protein
MLARQLSSAEAQRLTAIASEGAATCTGLMRYLRSQTARDNAGIRAKP